jgi:predicted DNA-binding protein
MTKEHNYKRSISLTPELNEKLKVLCEHLGVNIHSYMINVLAKSIQKDSIEFNLTQDKDEIQKMIEQALEKKGY